MRASFVERGGLWVIAQSLLMLAVAGVAVVLPGDDSRWWMVAVGTLLFAAGGAIGIAGAWVLGRNRTPFPRPGPEAPLVQHGVYAHIRHPLYASVMLASLGWALIWQSGPALAVAGLLIPFFVAKARCEERWLTQHYPEYADYQRRVRGFIPCIY